MGSWAATRFGVNPRLTNDRRRWWSGSSIEIIIDMCGPCGRGAVWLENVAGSFSMARTSACRVMPQTSDAGS